jgi:hypothetical protein
MARKGENCCFLKWFLYYARGQVSQDLAAEKQSSVEAAHRSDNAPLPGCVLCQPQTTQVLLWDPVLW